MKLLLLRTVVVIQAVTPVYYLSPFCHGIMTASYWHLDFVDPLEKHCLAVLVSCEATLPHLRRWNRFTKASRSSEALILMHCIHWNLICVIERKTKQLQTDSLFFHNNV